MTTTLTPIEGTRPHAALRYRHGDLILGVTHVTADAPELGNVATAVCGRRVVVRAIYEPYQWPQLRDRDHKHYVTGVCSRCARRTTPEPEPAPALPAVAGASWEAFEFILERLPQVSVRVENPGAEPVELRLDGVTRDDLGEPVLSGWLWDPSIAVGGDWEPTLSTVPLSESVRVVVH